MSLLPDTKLRIKKFLNRRYHFTFVFCNVELIKYKKFLYL